MADNNKYMTLQDIINESIEIPAKKDGKTYIIYDGKVYESTGLECDIELGNMVLDLRTL